MALEEMTIFQEERGGKGSLKRRAHTQAVGACGQSQGRRGRGSQDLSFILKIPEAALATELQFQLREGSEVMGVSFLLPKGFTSPKSW